MQRCCQGHIADRASGLDQLLRDPQHFLDVVVPECRIERSSQTSDHGATLERCEPVESSHRGDQAAGGGSRASSARYCLGCSILEPTKRLRLERFGLDRQQRVLGLETAGEVDVCLLCTPQLVGRGGRAIGGSGAVGWLCQVLLAEPCEAIECNRPVAQLERKTRNVLLEH